MEINKDKELEKSINSLKQLQQRNYSLEEQLHYIVFIANKFGLYDASDYIKELSQRL